MPSQRPSPPYFSALVTRLWSARRIASSSASTSGTSVVDLDRDVEAARRRTARGRGEHVAARAPPTSTGRARDGPPVPLSPAYSSTCSTMSVRRRPFGLDEIAVPLRLRRSCTTPADRFCAADRITASGVRSSCETVATKSICCAASRSDRRALTTMRPTLGDEHRRECRSSATGCAAGPARPPRRATRRRAARSTCHPGCISAHRRHAALGHRGRALVDDDGITIRCRGRRRRREQTSP